MLRSTLQLTLFLSLALSALLAHSETAKNALPLIEVVGKGKVMAKPDQAELSLNFSETQFKLEDARAVVDEQVSKLLKQLGKFEIADGSLDSSQVSIQPRYEYRSNNQRNFVGYQVSRNVSFKLNQLDQLNKLIKAISSEQINRLDAIRFVHSDPEFLRSEALDKAIEQSKVLANKIAESYEREIDTVYRVNYQTPFDQPAPRMMAMTEMASDARGSNYQQKDLVFEAQVHASFLMK